jgi:uncharacterized protein YjiS (DUF1127 family)
LRAILFRIAAFAALSLERARQRRALVELDDHMLKDVGITRGEVEREAKMPFWR